MMTTKEVIKHLGCSEASFYKWIKLGQIPMTAIRVKGRGNPLRWLRSDVEKLNKLKPLPRRSKERLNGYSRLLGVRLPIDLFNNLKSIADTKDVTISSVLRKYIEEGLENE